MINITEDISPLLQDKDLEHYCLYIAPLAVLSAQSSVLGAHPPAPLNLSSSPLWKAQLLVLSSTLHFNPKKTAL